MTSNSDTSMIRATDLCRYYGTDRRIAALENVTFEIAAGERVAVIGTSGSGKSTLLNVLAGLDRPSSGRLQVDGRDLSDLSRREMAGYRSQTTGVIFQSFQLLPQRSAFQNVELPLIVAGVNRSERAAIVETWLRRVGLQDRHDHFPWQLSGGEQQRVAIARAMVNRPKLLLADEPTGNLDTSTTTQIAELMLEVCDERNLTFILVTHEPELGSRCCQRQFRMSDGSLVDVVEMVS